MAAKVVTKDYGGNIISETYVNDGETLTLAQPQLLKSGDNVSNNKVVVIPLNKAFIALGTFLLTGGLIYYTGHVRYLWLLWLLSAAI